MIARTAFTQLRYSPLLLAGTLISMIVIYLVPPLFALAIGARVARLGSVDLHVRRLAPMLRYYPPSVAVGAGAAAGRAVLVLCKRDDRIGSALLDGKGRTVEDSCAGARAGRFVIKAVSCNEKPLRKLFFGQHCVKLDDHVRRERKRHPAVSGVTQHQQGGRHCHTSASP